MNIVVPKVVGMKKSIKISPFSNLYPYVLKDISWCKVCEFIKAHRRPTKEIKQEQTLIQMDN